MNIRLRPSPALVIACIALFVSLGGVSYGFATGSIDGREIKNSTITTKDIRNNQVRGADIRNSTIRGRDVALDTLGGNDIKESTLRKVPDADSLDGVDSTGFLRRGEAPGFAAIGLSGGATTVGGEHPPAFDVDGMGYVHLKGTFDAGAGVQLTLPQGARPAETSRFIVRKDAMDVATLTITPSGTGTLAGAPAGSDVSIDGVSFAAAP